MCNMYSNNGFVSDAFQLSYFIMLTMITPAELPVTHEQGKWFLLLFFLLKDNKDKTGKIKRSASDLSFAATAV